MDAYKTIQGEAEAEFEEKKSRFIGHIAFADTEEKALAFLERIRAKPVSYTHLDVYKRQGIGSGWKNSSATEDGHVSKIALVGGTVTAQAGSKNAMDIGKGSGADTAQQIVRTVEATNGCLLYTSRCV